MEQYNNVRSTIKPEKCVIDDYSVWINTDIRKIEVLGENGVRIEYEFEQARYSKDEYIKMLDDKNANLETQLTDTQLALCEVYEMML